MYVRDLVSHEVDVRGDGTRTLQQNTAQKADTMRASDKMDSCNMRAADLAYQHSGTAVLGNNRGTRPLRQTNLRLHVSRCSVQRSKRLGE